MDIEKSVKAGYAPIPSNIEEIRKEREELIANIKKEKARVLGIPEHLVEVREIGYAVLNQLKREKSHAKPNAPEV